MDEKLKLECEYYCHVLLQSRQRECRDDESECRDDESECGSECRVALKDLLVFPRVKELCAGVEDIRLAPWHHGNVDNLTVVVICRRVLESSPSPAIWLDPSADYAVLPARQEGESDHEDEECVSEAQEQLTTGGSQEVQEQLTTRGTQGGSQEVQEQLTTGGSQECWD